MNNYKEFLEQVVSEEFVSTTKKEARQIKRQAAAYLSKDTDRKLSQTDLKRLRAKTNKIKRSKNKANRAQSHLLSRQASQCNNFHK